MTLPGSILLFAAAVIHGVAMDAFQLQPAAQVRGDGVFLDDIVATGPGTVPHVRLAPAPRFGQAISLTRQQVEASLSRLPDADAGATNCIGAERIRITRRARPLDEEELRQMLTAQLSSDIVKDRGELELRMARPWAPVNVPDEALVLRVIDMPASGISPLFVCRFELGTAGEAVGTWQVSLNAKLWHEVWISRTALRRGATLAEADLVRERRDVLTVRDILASFAVPDASTEVSEAVAPNAPLLARSLKNRPVIRRGQNAEATVIDGALVVSLKVEVLEDGVTGQTIRVRNPQTKREFRGKIQNEHTILVGM